MTREEAIKKLSDQLNTWEAYDPDNGDLREAIEMAMETLQRVAEREAERGHHLETKKYKLSLSVWVDNGYGEYELREERRSVESRLPFPYLDTPKDVEEQLIEKMCNAMVQVQPTIFWEPKERCKDGRKQ